MAGLGLAMGMMMVPLTIMSFNILDGGTAMNMTTKHFCQPPRACVSDNLAAIGAAVRAARADVVVFQETLGGLPALARAAGLPYVSLRTHVASRWPLLNPPAGAGDPHVVLVAVAPGTVVAVSSAHALSTPYSPYIFGRRGPSALDQVLELERTWRAPPVLAAAQAAAAWVDAFWSMAPAAPPPLLLLGDFNSPSHLDWTDTVARAGRVPCPVRWPLSAGLAELGFADTFRSAWPDPISRPGYTWTPGGPEGAEPPDHETKDRIDWILWRGNNNNNSMGSVSASVVGPDHPPSDIIAQPWPSDHRAVVVAWSSLAAAPLARPLVSVLHRRIEASADAVVELYWWWPQPFSACRVDVGGSGVSALLTQPTPLFNLSIGSLQPQAYMLELWCGGALVSSAPFWYVSGTASVSVAPRAVVSGDPFTVHVSNAPGYMGDYIAVYASDPSAPAVYTYTGAIIEGAVLVGPPFFMEGNAPQWPLPPGEYRVRLMLDDDDHAPLGQEWVLEVNARVAAAGVDAARLAWLSIPVAVFVVCAVVFVVRRNSM